MGFPLHRGAFGHAVAGGGVQYGTAVTFIVDEGDVLGGGDLDVVLVDGVEHVGGVGHDGEALFDPLFLVPEPAGDAGEVEVFLVEEVLAEGGFFEGGEGFAEEVLVQGDGGVGASVGRVDFAADFAPAEELGGEEAPVAGLDGVAVAVRADGEGLELAHSGHAVRQVLDPLAVDCRAELHWGRVDEV